MSFSVVLTGLAANDPMPGTYTEILYAQGESAGFAGSYPALLMGNKSSAGSATTNTVIYGPDTSVPCQTEADVITLFGNGSELHRMWRRFVAVNRVTAVYLLAVTASGGTAASTTVVLTNAATANGNLRIWIQDEFVDVAIVSGDSITAIGDNAVTAVNAKLHWPVTVSNGAGTLTFTAKIAGPRGNDLRIMAAITGSGITTTCTKTASTAFASGATADSNTTALTTIAAKRFYYIASAAYDATQFGALVTQVNSMAQPITGIRQRAFCGSTDSLANTTTIATGINAARAEIVWQLSGDWTPPELAANHAGLVALLEAERKPRPRHNFARFPAKPQDQELWLVPAGLAGSVPTRANIVSALNNGITPIATLAGGKTQMVDRITTRSLSGSTADYRIRDAHKVTVCDFFADDLAAKIDLQFGGKDIASDPVDGAKQPGPDVVTPSIMAGAVTRVINDYDENDQLQDVERIKADTVVQRGTAPTTRMEIQVPLRPIDTLKQTATQILQVA